MICAISQHYNHSESSPAILGREKEVNKIKHLSDTYTSQPTIHFHFLLTYFVPKTDLAIIVEAKAHQLNFSNNFLCVYTVINHIIVQSDIQKKLSVKIPTPHTRTHTHTANRHPFSSPYTARITAPPSIIYTSSHPFTNPMFQLQKCGEKKNPPGNSGLLVLSENTLYSSFFQKGVGSLLLSLCWIFFLNSNFLNPHTDTLPGLWREGVSGWGSVYLVIISFAFLSKSTV